MLKQIKISNFKAFGKEQKIPLGKITLIYGPNSAGKSSIIQSILMMRQSTIVELASSNDSKIVFRGEDVDLGNFASAIHRHETSNSINIGFSFDNQNLRRTSARHHFSFPGIKSIDLRINSIPSSEDGKNGDAWVQDVSFSINDITTTLVRIPQEGKNHKDHTGNSFSFFRIKNEESARSIIKMTELMEKKENKKRVNSEGNYKNIEIELVKLWNSLKFSSISSMPGQIYFDKDFVENKEKFINSGIMELLIMRPIIFDLMRRELMAEFSNVSYLGPLRTPPSRHYIVSGSDKGSVGQRGERMPQLLYRRKSQLIPRLNDQLSQFEIPYKVNVSNAGDNLTGDIIAMSLTDARDVVVSPSDVGFGIGQLMPILVEGTVSSGKTICVEQPEIHLHPRLQGHLADFFFNTSMQQAPEGQTGKGEPFGGNQWIVESHSEALILRLQTLIKKRKIPSDFVTVLYVQPNDKGSQVIHLRLDKDGDFLDEWPDGFFEESFQEIFLNRH